MIEINYNVNENIKQIIKQRILNGEENAFFVFDIEDIINKYDRWLRLLPRVEPFYAVKCNNLPIVLETLAALGLGFDCSSQEEVEDVFRCGVRPEKIVFANACKPDRFLKYTRSVGVDLMTYDNVDELFKIKKHFPEARLILRIKVDDHSSTSHVNLKFGADISECQTLIQTALDLELSLVGVSFHVGSGCRDESQYEDAISKARITFDIAAKLGFKLSVLDIGGGFPGSENCVVPFEKIVGVINTCLEKYFDEKTFPDLKIIAEPGRYFAMSAAVLCTQVIAKRINHMSDGRIGVYYLNDGLYGSFSSVTTGSKVVIPIPIALNNHINYSAQIPSVLWGPTCDSYDCIRENVMLPELQTNDWLMFPDMGSYSVVASCKFNGMPQTVIQYHLSANALQRLKDSPNWQRISLLANNSRNQNH